MQGKQDKSTVQILKTNLLLDFFPRSVEVTKRRIPCTRLTASTPITPRFTLRRELGSYMECDC